MDTFIDPPVETISMETSTMAAIANPSSVSQQQSESVQEVLTGLFNSRPHRFQLDEWRLEERTLRNRIHRKEKNHSTVESEIFQLLGLFTLCQGVIFSAVAQTNLLKCRDWWIPVSMSLIVSFASVFALLQKLKIFSDLEEEIQKARSQAEGLYLSIQRLQGEGIEFDLNDLSNEPREMHVPPQEYVNLLSKLCFERILTHRFAVVSTVGVFSVIMLVSCPLLLCHNCKCL